MESSRNSPTVSVPPAAIRWRMPASFRLSLGFHILGAAVLVLRPGDWPWIILALMSNHLLLGLIGLWPRSQLLGQNLVRLPGAAAARGQLALTFDDGPDPAVTPHVLDLLDRFSAKASFFCVGERAAEHPELVREIIRRGHSVENHSQRHPHTFACFGPAALRREVDASQRLLTALAGQEPHFFRAPAGIRNPFLDRVMAQTGLRYISWTRRGFDAVRGEPRGVLARLCRGLAAGDVLLLHDGNPAKTPAGEPVVLAVLPELLERIAALGLTPVSLRTAWEAPAAPAPEGMLAHVQPKAHSVLH